MIDLSSDTVTRPSDAMRQAAAEAEVGDDVHRADPTVQALESAAADLLGTEAALYCPSGTMANQAAIRVHTDHGQEVLVELESHVYRWELGGLAQVQVDQGAFPAGHGHIGPGRFLELGQLGAGA